MAKTTIIQKTEIPEFLPHGWKKEVASLLGIHINTVTNSLKKGKGHTYERIKLVAINKWGLSAKSGDDAGKL
ncbi:hypothetical protein M2451_003915 [Dysgonomonas sp. PFB1-18]|uniref:hypothetical protein n=1 Tax=unclassified Dysgonomonas TaxID=2630389 RepID=UPI002475C590|nr:MULTISPECIES: hypothetical protein [unclassified Dysgonomonas]MDH6311026.1 hypothetical protein [Dysgonomonas sp. PF1-14]MDH6337875.1 hypothetical protein [Dysgonomonas sp. PF1-16]MDH6382574.1 hypothetical protein [Dysgonomonas sp. PFB1-18]MDH6398007.1 hypothetical protein [Dysgonomonas sp. PF1-23]